MNGEMIALRNTLIQKTDELSGKLVDYAETQIAILEERDEVWFGMDPADSVAERDRQADHSVIHHQRDRLTLEGEIAALRANISALEWSLKIALHKPE